MPAAAVSGAGAQGSFRGAERPQLREAMAKWLNKYFSLGNNKTKSPAQPLRPDYREKRNSAGRAAPKGPPQLHLHRSSPIFPHHRLCDDASDLLRAYRTQKDRDFEDPYSRPGLSLLRLHAMWRPDFSASEDLGEAASRGFTSSSCCTMPLATCAAGSSHLFGSYSKYGLAMPRNMKYISPKHRLIKVESSDGASKKLNKGSKQLMTSVSSAIIDKVSVVLLFPSL